MVVAVDAGSKILYAGNGNFAGILTGNIFRKRVSGSKHKFHSIGQQGSWGIDYDIIHKQLMESGIIEVIDIEDKFKVYKATVKAYRERGQVKHFKEDTVDHFTQVFLPIEEFLIV